MQAEKPENAEQQQIHEYPGEIQRGKRFGVMRIGVRVKTDEARRGARMALSTGGNKICGSDAGTRVGSGKNVVELVAIPAMRRLDIPERGYLRVKRVEIGGESLLVAAAASGRCFFLPRGCAHVGDLVGRMAIDAYGRSRVSGL